MSTATQANGAASASVPVLTRSAMLAILHISMWRPQVVDQQVTTVTLNTHNAVNDAGVFKKNLLAKTHLSDILEAATEARQFHYKNTLPWADRKARLLPAKNYTAYINGMRGIKNKFEQSVNQFINVYNTCVQQAQKELGTLFNINDYPQPHEVNEKFGIETDMEPVPDSNDFRVQIAEEERKRLQKEIEKKLQERHEAASRDVWNRLYTVVGKLAENLSKEDGRIMKAHFDNIAELTELMPALNINNDPELEKLCAEVKAKLLAAPPSALKTDKQLKKDIAGDANSILEKFPKFQTTKAA